MKICAELTTAKGTSRPNCRRGALRDDLGLLRHLNVAHLDELSAQKVNDAMKTIVSDFHERQKKTD